MSIRPTLNTQREGSSGLLHGKAKMLRPKRSQPRGKTSAGQSGEPATALRPRVGKQTQGIGRLGLGLFLPGLGLPLHLVGELAHRCKLRLEAFILSTQHQRFVLFQAGCVVRHFARCNGLRGGARRVSAKSSLGSIRKPVSVRVAESLPLAIARLSVDFETPHSVAAWPIVSCMAHLGLKPQRCAAMITNSLR